MNVNPDTDDEIGLTEDEIKEIIDNSELDATSSKSASSDEMMPNSFDDKSSTKRNINGLVEEIDLYDLNDEIDTVDLNNSDSESGDIYATDDRENLNLDNLIDFSGIDLNNEKEGEEQKKSPATSSTSSLSLVEQISTKVDEQTPKSKTNKKPKPKGKVIKKTKPAPKSLKSKTVPKQTSTNSVKKKYIKKKSHSSQVQKTELMFPEHISMSSVSESEMKALFHTLDEMLTHLPPKNIEEFVLSKEYETYFALLKKLGI